MRDDDSMKENLGDSKKTFKWDKDSGRIMKLTTTRGRSIQEQDTKKGMLWRKSSEQKMPGRLGYDTQ